MLSKTVGVGGGLIQRTIQYNTFFNHATFRSTTFRSLGEHLGLGDLIKEEHFVKETQ